MLFVECCVGWRHPFFLLSVITFGNWSLQSKDQQLTRLFPDSLPSWSFPTPCLPGGTQHLASSANKHPSMARCHWLDGGSRWTNLLPLYQWGELSTHHFSAGKHGTCGHFGHLGGWFFQQVFVGFFLVGLEVVNSSIYTLRFWMDLLNLPMSIRRLEVFFYFKHVTYTKASWETFQDSLISHTDGTEILAVLLPPDEWQDQQQLLNIFRGKDLVDVADGNAECVQRETRVLLNHYFLMFLFIRSAYVVSCCLSILIVSLINVSLHLVSNFCRKTIDARCIIHIESAARVVHDHYFLKLVVYMFLHIFHQIHLVIPSNRNISALLFAFPSSSILAMFSHRP